MKERENKYLVKYAKIVFSLINNLKLMTYALCLLYNFIPELIEEFTRYTLFVFVQRVAGSVAATQSTSNTHTHTYTHAC